MDIRENIKSWKWRIVKAGLTGTAFSKKVKLSQSALSDYMNGKKTPSLEMYEKIEKYLQKLGV